MTAPTRLQFPPRTSTRFRPEVVARPRLPASMSPEALDDDGPTPRQKRWAMVAAVIITALAMARPSLLDESDTTPVVTSDRLTEAPG